MWNALRIYAPPTLFVAARAAGLVVQLSTVFMATAAGAGAVQHGDLDEALQHIPALEPGLPMRSLFLLDKKLAYLNHGARGAAPAPTYHHIH